MVKLWDAASGQELFNLRGHTDSVGSVAFSPDGKRLISGSDTMVKIWDAASGHELLTLHASGFSVGDVAISPDGKRLVSIGSDSVLIWNSDYHPEQIQSVAQRRAQGGEIHFGRFHNLRGIIWIEHYHAKRVALNCRQGELVAGWPKTRCRKDAFWRGTSNCRSANRRSQGFTALWQRSRLVAGRRAVDCLRPERVCDQHMNLMRYGLSSVPARIPEKSPMGDFLHGPRTEKRSSFIPANRQKVFAVQPDEEGAPYY